MLSIRNLETAQQAANYFLKDDYYVGSGQIQPSMWWGRGAVELGLSGAVEHEVFEAALGGRLPSGVSLVGRDGQERRPGFDLTFSAPKSVSLLALLEDADGVARAHDRAVTDALSYLEEHATQTRSTSDKVTVFEKTRNLLVARFTHDTSRELDPQLHTHCVLINATKRADGAWRALSNERLYELKMLAGEIYRSSLAHELRSLGYDIDRKHADGRFEVRGFTDTQLDVFSQRRQAIEEALHQMGTGGAAASERAALMTRETKREVERSSLRQSWRQRAREASIAMPEPKLRETPTTLRELEARQAVRSAMEHLSEKRAVFEERHLLAHALAEATGRAKLPDIEAAVRHQLERGDLIEARAAASSGRAFVTAETVATERALLSFVKLGHGQFEPLVPTEQVRDRLRDKGLTVGQAAAVELLVTTGDGVVGVQGYAGTGKTTALREVKALAEAAGCEVRGFAPSAAAALLLQDEAGIRSQTLESHLIEQGRTASHGSASPKLWIVDEASMVSNRDALRLMQAARKASARLVLVGDRDQLPSVDAGAAFRLMSAQGMALTTMSEILRQRDSVLKKAVEHTIARDPKALELLTPAITSIADPAGRLDAVAKDVLATPANERERLLVLAVSNAERRGINDRIRAGLRREGTLVGQEQSASILTARDLTVAQARESAHYRPGDVVRFGRAYRQLRVAAGDYGTVEHVDIDRNIVRVRGADGESRSWSPHRLSNVEVYVDEPRHLAAGDRIRWTRNDKTWGRRNGETARVVSVSGDRVIVDVRGEQQTLDLQRERHWDHAYATTVHAAQGKTADAVVLAIDTSKKQLTGHESWYVAISRARSRVHIYTDDAARLPHTVQRSMAQETALEASSRLPARGQERG